MVTWCIKVESENACGAWDDETEIITARREIMIAASCLGHESIALLPTRPL